MFWGPQLIFSLKTFVAILVGTVRVGAKMFSWWVPKCSRSVRDRSRTFRTMSVTVIFFRDNIAVPRQHFGRWCSPPPRVLLNGVLPPPRVSPPFLPLIVALPRPTGRRAPATAGGRPGLLPCRAPLPRPTASRAPATAGGSLPGAGRSSVGLHAACIGKHLRRVPKVVLMRVLPRRPLQRALPNVPDI